MDLHIRKNPPTLSGPSACWSLSVYLLSEVPRVGTAIGPNVYPGWGPGGGGGLEGRAGVSRSRRRSPSNIEHVNIDIKIAYGFIRIFIQASTPIKVGGTFGTNIMV